MDGSSPLWIVVQLSLQEVDLALEAPFLFVQRVQSLRRLSVHLQLEHRLVGLNRVSRATELMLE